MANSFLTRVTSPFNVEKNSLLNTETGTTGFLHAERTKLDPYLTPYKKIKPKLTNNLNIRAKTVKHRVNLYDLGFGDGS